MAEHGKRVLIVDDATLVRRYYRDALERAGFTVDEAFNGVEALAPGGFICLGHTESMSRISPSFEVRRFADAIVYQRPLEKTHG